MSMQTYLALREFINLVVDSKIKLEIYKSKKIKINNLHFCSSCKFLRITIGMLIALPIAILYYVLLGL
jgi:hypothetical protein